MSEELAKRSRRHGFQRPFDPLQITGWVVCGSDVAIFASICLPFLDWDVALKRLFEICFGASIVGLVFAVVTTSLCDPAASRASVIEAEKGCFCKICDLRMMARTKHCRDCNKCVAVFDHHCKWLNACIGQRNYKWFLVTLGSVATMTFLILSCSVYLFIRYLSGDDEHAMHGDYISKEVTLGVSCVLIIVNLPLFVLEVQLILLHVFLRWRRMTTYEYILYKIDMERNRGPGETMVKRLANGARSLPRCMDWIVYQPKKKNSATPSDAKKTPSRLPGTAGSAKVSPVDVTPIAIARPARLPQQAFADKGYAQPSDGEGKAFETFATSNGNALDEKVAEGAPHFISTGSPFEPSALVAISVPAATDAPVELDTLYPPLLQ